ncbi:hypothetical protein [Candidatus Protochlamydia phocaeensis]|uniref:hypothetical protein n=1 Tax=Candidatus Protochlamydia phocaeensis TaxID=1414722 RepID=UPI0012AB6A48|nr:hypothetical protein [Candidatus Protochlamydia phocaeensis]
MMEIFSHASLKHFSSEQEVVLSGLVHVDGKGDYFHIRKLAKVVKQLLPANPVSMVVLSDSIHKDTLFPPKNISQSIVYEEYGCHGYAFAEFPEDTLEKIEQAALFLEVSWPISLYSFNLARENVKNKIQIHEYNHVNQFHSSSHQVKMGIDLEGCHKGIFLKDYASRQVTLAHLKKTALKAFLFGTAYPTAKETDNYTDTHHLHLAYLHDPETFYIKVFIYTLITAQQDNKSIDVCLPIEKLEELELDQEFLKKQGIGKIQFILLKDEESQIEEITIQEGKTLRLINPFPLKHSDMITLMHASSVLVGCTGDHSISEVMGCNKCPFYEIASHKWEFWKNFMAVGQAKLGPDSPLIKYFQILWNIGTDRSSLQESEAFEQICQSQALELAHCIQDPLFAKHMKEFYSCIRENHVFNDKFIGIVKFYLLQSQDPCLQALLERLRIEFIEGKLALEDTEESIKEWLRSFSYLPENGFN